MRRVDIVVHDVLSDGVIANGKDEVGCRQAHSNEIVKQPHFFDLKAVVDNISYFVVNVIFWSFLYLDEFQFIQTDQVEVHLEKFYCLLNWELGLFASDWGFEFEKFS